MIKAKVGHLWWEHNFFFIDMASRWIIPSSNKPKNQGNPLPKWRLKTKQKKPKHFWASTHLNPSTGSEGPESSAVSAERDGVTGDPLIGILSSLGSYSLDYGSGTQVDLQPLLGVTVASHPGSGPATTRVDVEPGPVGPVVVVVGRRCAERAGQDPAVLQTQW